MDSRTLAFADDIMAATNGDGVDVVLNSLAGEAIPKGIEILRPHGRFVGIGKRDFCENSKIGLGPFLKGLSFLSIDPNHMFTRSLIREVVGQLADRKIQPLPKTVFKLSEAETAFRYMAQAKHVGKIILTVDEDRYSPDARAQNYCSSLMRPICSPAASAVSPLQPRSGWSSRERVRSS